ELPYAVRTRFNSTNFSSLFHFDPHIERYKILHNGLGPSWFEGYEDATAINDVGAPYGQGCYKYY
ncbi:MAG: hypothetical protein WA667_16985, partial [Candidatus Nitrosopolaris sp.]